MWRIISLIIFSRHLQVKPTSNNIFFCPELQYYPLLSYFYPLLSYIILFGQTCLQDISFIYMEVHMDTATMLELFGYLGSAIVIVSMLMTSVVKLRVINTIGSLLFSIYALLIHSYPTMAMNLVLAGINIYHLIRLRNTERHYDMIELAPDRPVMKYLFGYFTDDIHRYFPGFSPEKASDCVGFLVLCQASPAGVLLARPVYEAQSGMDGSAVTRQLDDPDGSAVTRQLDDPDGPVVATTLEVVLDYSTPKYRDCSVGRYLYSCLPDFGYKRLVAEGSSKQHIKYLKKMGFRRIDEGHYILDL